MIITPIISNKNMLNKTAKFMGNGFDFEKVFEEIKSRAYQTIDRGYAKLLSSGDIKYQDGQDVYWIIFDTKSKFGNSLIDNSKDIIHKGQEMFQEEVIALRYDDIFKSKNEIEMTEDFKYHIMVESFDVLTEFGIEARLMKNPYLQ